MKGIEEKRWITIPRVNKTRGYRETKSSSIPKVNKARGHRGTKTSSIPRGNKASKTKEIQIKRNTDQKKYKIKGI